MNCLVSELADVAAQERAMLDECEALLASTAAMQVITVYTSGLRFLQIIFSLLPIRSSLLSLLPRPHLFTCE